MSGQGARVSPTLDILSMQCVCCTHAGIFSKQMVVKKGCSREGSGLEAWVSSSW